MSGENLRKLAKMNQKRCSTAQKRTCIDSADRVLKDREQTVPAAAFYCVPAFNRVPQGNQKERIHNCSNEKIEKQQRDPNSRESGSRERIMHRFYVCCRYVLA